MTSKFSLSLSKSLSAAPRFISTALLSLSALAGTAAAQDSVSRNANGGSGLPGDALAAWGSINQRSPYVLDLASFETASGVLFGIGPLGKSSRLSANRFSAINGTSVLSSDQRTDINLSALTFARWTQPGGGLNISENNTALNTSISGPTNATLLSAAWLDFEDTLSGTTPVFANQLIGAQLAFDPTQPSRFYITRVVAAANATSATATDTAQFGIGSVDASGNLVFRADSFGSAASTNLISGDNYFRTRLDLRNTSNNIISQSGATDAASTTRILSASNVLHTTPSLIPASLAGRSVLVGSDFAGNLRSETSTGIITSSTLHRPGTLDHRGPLAVFARPVLPGASVATGLTLTRSTSGAGSVDSFSLFGLDASGTVTQARTISLPATLSDPCDPFSWNIAGSALRGYDSQVSFRGGNGPAAIGLDAAGRALVAGVAYSGSTPDPINPYNAIVVARFNPTSPTSPVAWTLAAWVDPAGSSGKPIFGDYGTDGTPNTNDAGEGDGIIDATPIGRLAAMTETALGSTGPSISSPAFDAAGNLYFIATTSLNRRDGQAIVQDRVASLIRAIYDPANLCYQLDLVARVGQTFAGQNSGRIYRIAELHVADSDSVSSAALWSGSTTARAWNNADTSALDPAAPQHLGGLVISARLEYDTDNDGDFEDPSLFGGNPASTDEAYNVVLLVANVTPLAPVGPACDYDFNQDENVDLLDAQQMAQVFVGTLTPEANWLSGDLNGDENADLTDAQLLAQFVVSGNCPL